MPRVKPLTEHERKNRNLRGRIVGEMRNENLTYKQVAEILGVSVHTVYRRIERPETLTLQEVWKLEQAMPGLEI